MTRKELEDKVGVAFTELVAGCGNMELITLQHDLRKTQPEDKDHLRLVLLELRERDREDRERNQNAK